MSSVALGERPRIALRPLALPSEHGGWGFLLEPLVLGLLVAPSAAGTLIAGGAVAIFLMRHPLKLAVRDWLRRRRYPRTAACERFITAYGFTAVALLAGAVAMSGPGALLPLLIAVPFALTQFGYDVRNRSRALTAEMLGVMAPGALAAAIALAAGRPTTLAITLWLLVALRSGTAVLYIRSLLRGESRRIMIAAHLVAVAATLFFAPPGAIVAMAFLCLRALPPSRGIPARTIGFRELGWGALTVALIAAGLR